MSLLVSFGKFDIVSTDLCLILSIFVTTDVYVLFSTASGALGVVPFSDTILYNIIPEDRFEGS